MNRTVANNQPQATSENTVFLTVAAYPNYEVRTATLRKSADDHGVSLVFCDTGEAWKGFYHHKIETMGEHLKRAREDGKHFAFILDSRDVVFIETIDTILAKWNALNDGRAMFNQDVPGKVWPSHKDYLARAIGEAMGAEHARLNAGMIAGNIDTILTIHHNTMELRRELKEGRPRPGMSEKLYQDIGTKHLCDDQHLYQICLTYYPELFRIDCSKELFAVLKKYPQNLRGYSDDPKRHDVINNAAIVHSPWLSKNQQKWNDWVFQNRWKR